MLLSKWANWTSYLSESVLTGGSVQLNLGPSLTSIFFSLGLTSYCILAVKVAWFVGSTMSHYFYSPRKRVLFYFLMMSHFWFTVTWVLDQPYSVGLLYWVGFGCMGYLWLMGVERYLGKPLISKSSLELFTLREFLAVICSFILVDFLWILKGSLSFTHNCLILLGPIVTWKACMKMSLFTRDVFYDWVWRKGHGPAWGDPLVFWAVGSGLFFLLYLPVMYGYFCLLPWYCLYRPELITLSFLAGVAGHYILGQKKPPRS